MGLKPAMAKRPVRGLLLARDGDRTKSLALLGRISSQCEEESMNYGIFMESWLMMLNNRENMGRELCGGNNVF